MVRVIPSEIWRVFERRQPFMDRSDYGRLQGVIAKAALKKMEATGRDSLVFVRTIRRPSVNRREKTPPTAWLGYYAIRSQEKRCCRMF